MNIRSAFRLLYALVLMTSLALGTGLVRAQQTTADDRQKLAIGAGDQPTPESDKNKAEKTQADKTKTDSAKGSAAPTQGPEPSPSAYTVVSSIEFGVRGVGITGNADKYRSDLNYTPGFRIFDSSLMMKSNNGDGLLFDQLMVNSFGWGTDPNRYLRVSSEKTKLYKFDANYRRLDYFNSLTNLALGQHTANTEYRQGDFDLTLFPANKRFRLNLGYSLDRNTGPSVLTYDYQRDEFPVLAPTRQSADDYRIGFDSKLWVFDMSFLQGWRLYKEDTTYLVDMPQPGNNPLNTSVINTYQRDLPIRGETPYTRFSLHTFLKKRFDFTGRYIYSSSNTDYTLFETITGTDASNNKIVLDTWTANGNAKRPNAIGDLAATVLVTDRLRISDTFRVQTFRIDGGDILSEVLLRSRLTPFGETPLPPLLTNTLSLRTTNYRRYVNLVEGDFDINTRLSFHLGYRYTNRHIEERANDFAVGGVPPEAETQEFDNHTDSVIFGFKARPLKLWTLYFDLEHGTNDNVFTRTANYDYTNVRLRSIWRPTNRLSINASLTTKNNTNPSLTEELTLFGADINTRIFSSSVDWTPSDKFNLTSGYSFFHIGSEASIIFFLNSVKTQGLARYFMNDHFAFLTAYYEPHPRVRLYAGYRIHNDRGEGDRGSTPTLLISSFPYQFESPEVKISVKLHKNVDWIAGYQYYDYKEKFVNNQFYQVHLPYTSLRIYFGRGE
jgi:hypothetical protein